MLPRGAKRANNNNRFGQVLKLKHTARKFALERPSKSSVRITTEDLAWAGRVTRERVALKGLHRVVVLYASAKNAGPYLEHEVRVRAERRAAMSPLRLLR